MAIAGWGKVREESLKKALPRFPFHPQIENLSVVKGSFIFYQFMPDSSYSKISFLQLKINADQILDIFP